MIQENPELAVDIFRDLEEWNRLVAPPSKNVCSVFHTAKEGDKSFRIILSSSDCWNPLLPHQSFFTIGWLKNSLKLAKFGFWPKILLRWM